METTYSVIFTGQLQPDADQDEVIRKMAELTRSPEEKIRPIFSLGKPVVIKKGLSKEEAEKYVRRLGAIGMHMKVGKSQAKQPGTGEADPNPYAAPKADLAVEQKGAHTFLETPQKVPAGNGWRWIVDGFKLFFSEFWKWIGIALVFFVIMIPVSIIPIIGNILNPVISIILVGGFLIGANSLYEGNGLRFGHLFSGFTQNRTQLLFLGLYYLLGMILITIIALLPVGSAMISFFMGSGFDDPEAMSSVMIQKMPLFILGGCIGLLLSIPFMMSFWFAPALVAVSGRSCSVAVKLSFRGTIRNMLPLLVYSIGLIVFGLVSFAAMTGLTMAMAFIGGESTFFLVGIVPFLLITVLALPFSLGIGLSVYTGFRDIYYQTN
jgi:hypothetical protein